MLILEAGTAKKILVTLGSIRQMVLSDIQKKTKYTPASSSIFVQRDYRYFNSLNSCEVINRRAIVLETNA
jgi:hypothetical protein